MSKQYICDITGKKVTSEDVGETVVKQANIVLNGVPVSMEVVVRIDAFNGAIETHVSPEVWKTVWMKIKTWIELQEG